MELYIYSQSFEFVGVLDDFFSLRWRRKYFTCGEFELHSTANEQSLRLLRENNILSKKGSVEAGIIEDIVIEDNEETGETIIVKGRFLSSLLDRRITGDTVLVTDTAQNAMRKYVSENCISPVNLDRAMPLLQLGEPIADTEQIQVQATHKSVLATCEKLSLACTNGFRIRPSFSERKLYFEVYSGIDKSINQSVRPHVILSDEYDNTKNTIYTYSGAAHKTFCKVCGASETESKIYSDVGGGAGFNRREMYVDASESKAAEVSLIDYQALLVRNGIDALKQAEAIENFETEVDLLQYYKIAWDLGDIVSCIKSRWNRQLDARITEVEEIYENGIEQVIPTLGNPLPELIDLLEKE